MNKTPVEFTAFGFVQYNANNRPVISIVDKAQNVVAVKTLGYYEHIATSLKEMARNNGYRIISPGIVELTDSVAVGYYELLEVK